ncbi:MAG: NAD(P)H:quinone oxidoreductase [Chloroflexota bacterium]
MSTVKLNIVFYSSTGTNFQIAQEMQKAAEEAGANVRLRKVHELAPQAAIDSNPAWKATVEAMADIPEVSPEDMEWANAYILGSPTRFGNMAAQMKQFIDTLGGLWFNGALANKVASAFTSAQNTHGGQEVTIHSLHTVFNHWGCIIVPPGYTDPVVFANGGNPYGTSTNGVSRDQPTLSETTKAAAAHQARRVVQVAGWLAAGQQSE